MTWYADLGPLDYFRESSYPYLRAVGWLEYGRPFTSGETSPGFFERLCVLLLDPWDPYQFRGFHECELCLLEPPSVPSAAWGFSKAELKTFREMGARKEMEPILVGGEALPMGRLNLFVPGEGCVYVAPSLIAHCVQAHGYAPPQEFVDAVMRCPETHSEEYRHARTTLPLEEFVRWTFQCREPRSPEYLKALRASGAADLADWTPWWVEHGQP